MTDVSNNNDASLPLVTCTPDAHGHAALLLVESLLHGLMERAVLSLPDTIEIVGTAADVQQDIVEDLGDNQGTLHKSLGILNAISLSLQTGKLSS